jgi:uncharacterized membrane protein YphA (DoxX/SURF4 family)
MAVRQIIPAESSKREYQKFLGVLLFIILTSTLMSTLISISLVDWLRWFIGSSLLVFGGFKLISYETFSDVFPVYDFFGNRSAAYTMAYPIIQIILAICYILDLLPSFRNIFTLVITVVGLISVYSNLAHHGPSKNSTTLGKALRLPMSSSLLFEDGLLATACLILIVTNLLT